MSKINLTPAQQTELDNILRISQKALGSTLTKKQAEEITNVYISDIEEAEAKAKADAEAKVKADKEMHEKRRKLMEPHDRLNKA
jgi:hypothetical protein